MELESTHIAILGMFSAIAILSLYLIKNCYFTVIEGNQAVLVRFGKVLRTPLCSSSTAKILDSTDLRIIEPGLHFKFPWDKVILFSRMERQLDLSGPNEGQYALTSDGTLLRLDSKIRFSPKSSHLYSYLFDLDAPIEHIRDLFICLLRNEIANFSAVGVSDGGQSIGSYDLIRRHRQILNEKMGDFCKKIGDKYGVDFKSVDLIDILPPPELEKALNSILKAQTEAETWLMRAEADADQKREAAERNVEIAKVEAEALVTKYSIITKNLDELIHDNTLDLFLKHKRDEVITAAKMRIVQTEIGV